jgi:cyclic nucleotide gated channel
LRTNYPVGRMLFILRGKLESIGDDGFRAIINEGEFCGDELLTWCIENAAVQSSK